MKWNVSVFTANGDRLIWAAPAPTLAEAIALTRTAAHSGYLAFLRSPRGKVTRFGPWNDEGEPQ